MPLILNTGLLDKMKNLGYNDPALDIDLGSIPGFSPVSAPLQIPTPAPGGGGTIPVLQQVTDLSLPPEVLSLLEQMKSERLGPLSEIQSMQLPGNVQNLLGQLRDERISGIKGDLDTLIGSTVADLARKGMMSSTMAGGAFGDITKAALPAISGAHQDYYTSMLELPFRRAQTMLPYQSSAVSDYWAQRLGLPFTQAQQRLGVGAGLEGLSQGFGQYGANALQNSLSTILGPLLNTWQTTLQQGANMPMGGTTTSTTPGISPIQSLIYGWAGAGFPLPKFSSPATSGGGGSTSPGMQSAINSGKYSFAF